MNNGRDKKLQAAILAAGESSRFWPFSEKTQGGGHKSLFKIAGRPIVRYTVDGLLKHGIKDIILVHAPGMRGSFEKALAGAKTKITYVTQPQPLGTGDALKRAKEFIKNDFVLLNAAHIHSEKMIALLKKARTGKKFGILTTETESPERYAVVTLGKSDKKKIVGIAEKPEKPETNIKTVGVYLLPLEFVRYLDEETGEYALVEALHGFVKENDVREVRVEKETSSIKYAFDVLGAMDEIFSAQKRVVSKKAKIAKSAAIKGDVYVGDGTEILENTVIKGPAWIGKNCVIGNNAVIRPNTIIEDNVKIGAGTEIKHSCIGEGAHIHSGYIGDSVIGENCRLAAGFITGNRRIDRENIKFTLPNFAKQNLGWQAGQNKIVDSGKTYLGCVMGANTKTGVYATTMPGTIIGSNCVIGSNTEVKGTIPSGSLVYAKQETIIKQNG